MSDARDTDELRALRYLSAVVRGGEAARKQRDLTIVRLRNRINPATGKPWTCEQIAQEAGITRVSVHNASKRVAQAGEGAS